MKYLESKKNLTQKISFVKESFLLSKMSLMTHETDHKQMLKDVVVNLLYPAVLGTIYNTIETKIDISSYTSKNWTLLGLQVVIIVHYIIDYMYTIYFEGYSFIALFLDLFIIGLMLYSTSLVKIQDGMALVNEISLSFALSYFIFVIIDINVLMKIRHPRQLITVCSEIFVLFLFIGFYLLKLQDPLILLVLISFASFTLYNIAPKPIKALPEYSPKKTSHPQDRRFKRKTRLKHYNHEANLTNSVYPSRYKN